MGEKMVKPKTEKYFPKYKEDIMQLVFKTNYYDNQEKTDNESLEQ